MLLRRTRGSDVGGYEKDRREENRGKKRMGRGTVGDTAQGNWKFLLPLRFHFTPNHATVAGFIQRALTRFATETSLRIDTSNETERWKVTVANRVGAF